MLLRILLPLRKEKTTCYTASAHAHAHDHAWSSANDPPIAYAPPCACAASPANVIHPFSCTLLASPGAKGIRVEVGGWRGGDDDPDGRVPVAVEGASSDAKKVRPGRHQSVFSIVVYH